MKAIPIVLCLLTCLSVSAQRGVVHYTRENGLISNEVIDVAYDRDGFIWISTTSGIDRFDGQRFIHFQHDPSDASTICSNNVTRIAYDPKGYIWASTMNSGLIRISTKTLRVRNYRHDPKNTSSISDNRATAIFVDPDNETWFCQHYRGLDHYDAKNDRFVNYRPTDQYKQLDPRMANLFSSVIADRNDKNVFWCASLDGLFSFNKQTKQWKHFPVRENRFLEPTSTIGFENSMRCIEQDGKGNFYIGTWGGGLLYFDKNQGVYRRFLYESAQPPSGMRNSISDIKWRDVRYLYVCATSYEFILFDTKTKEFIRYDEAERTITMPYRMARFGKQIAIAGAGHGLFIHNESLIFGRRERYPFDMRSVVFNPEKRNEWLACSEHNNGQAYFKAEGARTGRVYELYHGVRQEEFHFQQPHYLGKYGYYIVASDRILSFSPQSGLKEAADFGQLGGNIRLHATTSLISFNDGDSAIWIGTKYAGLIHFSARTGKLTIYRHDRKDPSAGPSHDGWLFALARSGTTLYYGHEEGVGAVDLRTRRFFDPGLDAILPRDQVRTLSIDPSGKLWVGMLANGILVVDTKQRKVLKNITARMGLQTQRVDRITSDNHGNMWVLTPYCVAIIDRKDYSLQSLENQHGMNGVYDIVLHGNRLYFLQKNGFVVSVSGVALPRINQPKPYIQRVRELNDRPFERNRTEFGFDENNLAFEFGVLDYSNNMNNFVSYRLKGLEEKWRSGNGKDEAAYYNLPGGQYVFQVRVIEDGRSSMDEYAFRIVPPFWVQWWFIALVFLAVAAGIWWYMRVRIRRAQSTERMRHEFDRQINEMEAKALRAQMNPHFLFNSLNSIRLFILKNEVESASDYIAKFSKLLRMILNHSRQDAISVYDEIQSLKLYLEFERLRFDRGFEFDLQIDGQAVLDCQLPPMIIQPFVENAIWHGLMPRTDEKGYIKVSFQKEPGRLSVTVQDNGIGRQKARENNRRASLKEGSVGLQITKDRLRTLTRRTGLLNDFVIEDLVDENGTATGTLIKLYFETEEK